MFVLAAKLFAGHSFETPNIEASLLSQIATADRFSGAYWNRPPVSANTDINRRLREYHKIVIPASLPHELVAGGMRVFPRRLEHRHTGRALCFQS
jgi:hypothetical protein